MSEERTPGALGSNDQLGPLVEAAEKYAANYNDDDRQDICCDVLNAWHAGAKFAQAAERERCVRILEAYRVPVGNSAAGEMAAEWTMDALREIRDAICGA